MDSWPCHIPEETERIGRRDSSYNAGTGVQRDPKKTWRGKPRWTVAPGRLVRPVKPFGSELDRACARLRVSPRPRPARPAGEGVRWLARPNRRSPPWLLRDPGRLVRPVKEF